RGEQALELLIEERIGKRADQHRPFDPRRGRAPHDERGGAADAERGALAVFLMYSGVSRFALRIRPRRISQNLPCSPAQRAARAAGIACAWKSSGKSRLM